MKLLIQNHEKPDSKAVIALIMKFSPLKTTNPILSFGVIKHV